MAPDPVSLFQAASPLSKLRAAFCKEEKDDPFAHGCSTVGPEEEQWFAQFALADVLEQGIGPGLALKHMEPTVDHPSVEERLLVEAGRLDSQGNFTLTTGHGEPLLFARPSGQGGGFDIYLASCDTGPREMGPSFRLEYSQCQKMDCWTLFSVRCDQCQCQSSRASPTRRCGGRELMSITQYFEKVGEGQAFSMDVELPRACESGSPGRCKVCSAPPSQEEPRRLTTIRPRWNAAQKSLALSFHGRVSMASIRNFQLQDRFVPCEPGKPLLLFGQVAENSYVLDFRHPFGAVQAFAAALTCCEGTQDGRMQRML